MRKILLVAALCLLTGGLLVWLLEDRSGYVLIAVGETTIELNLWFAVLCLAAAITLWWLLKGLWRSLARRGSSMIGYLKSNPGRSARQRTSRGIQQFFEGKWEAARRDLTRSAKYSEMPVINYLVAANAALEEGNIDEVQQLLAKAEQTASGADLAISLVQARIHLRAGRCEEALTVLARLRSQYPEHLLVMKLLLEVYRALGDWRNLEKLLPDLQRCKVLSEVQYRSLIEEVYRSILDDEADKAMRGGPSRREDFLALWEKFPAGVRTTPALVVQYAGVLNKLGAADKAEILLRRTLKKQWQPDLVRQYGHIEATDAASQLQVAENWLKEQPRSAELLLTLGRLCLRNHLWGKARDYLEASLEQKRLPETYVELAQLMDRLGEHEKSAQYYQRGLLQFVEVA